MPHQILSHEIAIKKIERMAYEIAERNAGAEEIIFAGIQKNGFLLSGIIKEYLTNIFTGNIHMLPIDIDKKNPQKLQLPVDVDFNDKVIIIIDDVSNSGRTLTYALRPFLNFYPKKIQTLVLIERSYREFPAAPDYVGLSVATALNEKIIVEIHDQEVSAFLSQE